MPGFMKGNYELEHEPEEVERDADADKSLTERFEESALAKLGGSICFVRKTNALMWAGDEDENPS